MNKKIITKIIATLFIITTIEPAFIDNTTAFAADSESNNSNLQVDIGTQTPMVKSNYMYQYQENNDNTLTITRCYEESESIKFPEEIDGCKVTKIAICGKKLSPKVKKIEIPDSVKSIGGYSFSSSKLQEVVLGSNVQKIEEYAFANCPLLEKVSVDKNIEFIGKSAFANCPKLKCLKIPNENVKLYSNVSYNDLYILHNGEYVNIKDINSYAFKFDKNTGTISEYNGNNILDRGIMIPDEIDGVKVKYIKPSEQLKSKGLGIFGSNSNIEVLSFESGKDIEICEGAFRNTSNLVSADLASVKKVGQYTFEGCRHFKNIKFNNLAKNSKNIIMPQNSIDNTPLDNFIYGLKDESNDSFISYEELKELTSGIIYPSEEDATLLKEIFNNYDQKYKKETTEVATSTITATATNGSNGKTADSKNIVILLTAFCASSCMLFSKVKKYRK